MDATTPNPNDPDHLTPEEHEALEKLCSRIGFKDFRELATSDTEAYAMRNALIKAARLTHEPDQH